MKNQQLSSEQEQNPQRRKKKPLNWEQQIQYYGNPIEPFNLNNQKQIGKFDNDGCFIFNKSKQKQYNDPWLQSLQDQIIKKAQNLQLKNVDQCQSESSQQNLSSNQQKQEQKIQESLKRPSQERKKQQILIMILELLPPKMSIAIYLKQLKPRMFTNKDRNKRRRGICESQKRGQQSWDKEIFERLLQLGNEYMKVSQDGQIFQKSKQQLQQILDGSSQTRKLLTQYK